MNKDNFWDYYEPIALMDRNINKTKKIQFSKAKKDNISGIDIREYYLKNGEFLPSKGIFIPNEYLNKFKSILDNIAEK